MYRKLFVFVLISLVVTMGGCATLKELVQDPAVKFKGVSFRNMSLFEATPVFEFEVTNPNPVGIPVTKIAYDLKINDKPFIKDVMDKGMTLAAGGSEILELPVTFNYLDLIESVADFDQSDSFAYELSGSVSVGIFDIPYHKKGELPIPKLPKVSVRQLDVSSVSLTGASMMLALDLENSNSFAIKLSGLDYGLKLGGKEFARGKVQNISSIGENSKSVLEIPMNVSFLRLGRSLYNLLEKSSSEYELSGSMTFDIPSMGEKSFSFQKSGNVPFYK